jgi:hypothetical protein
MVTGAGRTVDHSVWHSVRQVGDTALPDMCRALHVQNVTVLYENGAVALRDSADRLERYGGPASNFSETLAPHKALRWKAGEHGESPLGRSLMRDRISGQYTSTLHVLQNSFVSFQPRPVHRPVEQCLLRAASRRADELL